MTVLGVHDECVTFPVCGVHLISKMAWVCRGLFRKILGGGGGGTKFPRDGIYTLPPLQDVLLKVHCL